MVRNAVVPQATRVGTLSALSRRPLTERADVDASGLERRSLLTTAVRLAAAFLSHRAAHSFDERLWRTVYGCPRLDSVGSAARAESVVIAEGWFVRSVGDGMEEFASPSGWAV
jgi:hypothetical protein